jgi:hypothetical protein
MWFLPQCSHFGDLVVRLYFITEMTSAGSSVDAREQRVPAALSAETTSRIHFGLVSRITIFPTLSLSVPIARMDTVVRRLGAHESNQKAAFRKH